MIWQRFSRLPLSQFFELRFHVLTVLSLRSPPHCLEYHTIIRLLPDSIAYLATWAFCSGKNFMYGPREGPGAVILHAGTECKVSRYPCVGTFYRLRFHCARQGAVRVRERLTEKYFNNAMTTSNNGTIWSTFRKLRNRNFRE